MSKRERDDGDIARSIRHIGGCGMAEGRHQLMVDANAKAVRRSRQQLQAASSQHEHAKVIERWAQMRRQGRGRAGVADQGAGGGLEQAMVLETA
jgi:hypothetical protein